MSQYSERDMVEYLPIKQTKTFTSCIGVVFLFSWVKRFSNPSSIESIFAEFCCAPSIASFSFSNGFSARKEVSVDSILCRSREEINFLISSAGQIILLRWHILKYKRIFLIVNFKWWKVSVQTVRTVQFRFKRFFQNWNFFEMKEFEWLLRVYTAL